MSALADLYRAQADETNARIPLLTQQARQTSETADQVAPDSEAKRAQDYAAAGLAGAQASSLNTKTPAEVGEINANTSNILGRTNILGPQSASDLATAALQRQSIFGSPTFGTTSPALIQAIRALQTGQGNTSTVGFEKGGVVGKDKAKPGKTDTVPAMLAPGEAVLNKGAVEHYGPHLIGHMNAMGKLRDKAHRELTAMIKKTAGTKKAARKKKAA